MYSTEEVTLSLAMEGERFYLELEVRTNVIRSVLVREIHWYRSTYDDKRVFTHLFAIGRWKTNNGTHSQVDARATVKEDQLPPAVLAKLKELKGK
jgi:hypothetical protein